MKRLLALFLLAAMLLTLSACGKKGSPADGEAASFSFSDAVDIKEIKALNNRTVSIIGYMATLSPISGKYMYLMNMPYQSCPFCVPNTSQLSNTMAVYAPEGKTFSFTDQAIRVTGTLRVEDYEDEYGYTYNYRIVNASYEEVDLSTVSSDYALWQTIAADGIVGDINSMFDFAYFVCQWTDYTLNMTDENGEPAVYSMYPGDVENFLEDDGPNGYASYMADDYFPGLIARLNAISETEFTDLIEIVNDAHNVVLYGLKELSDGNYTYNEEEDAYTLNNAEDLYNAWREVYVRFSEWLAEWQL